MAFADFVHHEALANFRARRIETAQGWLQCEDDRASLATAGVAGIESYSQLVGLRPTDLLARWLEGTVAFHVGPNAKKRQLVGYLQPEDGVGYVVYRLDSAGPHGHTRELHVLHVLWTDLGWRIMLNNDLSFDGARMVVIRHDPSADTSEPSGGDAA